MSDSAYLQFVIEDGQVISAYELDGDFEGPDNEHLFEIDGSRIIEQEYYGPNSYEIKYYEPTDQSGIYEKTDSFYVSTPLITSNNQISINNFSNDGDESKYIQFVIANGQVMSAYELDGDFEGPDSEHLFEIDGSRIIEQEYNGSNSYEIKYYVPTDQEGIYVKTDSFITSEPIIDINDRFIGSSNDEVYHGFYGDDYLNGNDGSDDLFGDIGDDEIYGGNGDDNLYGGNGDDYLNGGTGSDYLSGGAGNDTYIIDENDDLIEYSGQGFDSVKASFSCSLGANFEKLILTGTSQISGIGNTLANIIIGNNVANNIQGNAGNDTLSGKNGNDTLLGGSGQDTLRGDRDNDALNGGADRDKLYGGTGNDSLVGGGGYDRLHGGSGTDILDGGIGNDYLVATFGGDTLTGGTGADKFRFYKPTHGNDKITDFNRAEDDTIQVSSRNFARLAKGTLSKYRFASNSSGVALDSNDYFVFNTTNKVLYFDADGSGSGAAVQIARMKNGVNLLNTDIVIV